MQIHMEQKLAYSAVIYSSREGKKFSEIVFASAVVRYECLSDS